MAITGQPSIEIVFKEKAATAIQRSQKGTVALLIKESKKTGPTVLTDVTQIPKEFSAQNQEQIRRAFRGNDTPTKKVIVYAFDGEKLPLESALNHLDTVHFDYLAPFAEIKATDTETIALWVKAQRAQGHRVKAVLPNSKSDHEGIINFTTKGISEIKGEVTQEVTTEGFCARMAGLIAGTSLSRSATYSVLGDIDDVERMTAEEQDKAVASGEFILFHDGEKVKTGRAINSFTTVTPDKGETFQKIKTVEIMDMIYTDVHTTLGDYYVGKLNNSYDNKCLVVIALAAYLMGLETEGILETGSSGAGIDREATRLYLESKGTDTSEMTDQAIRQSPTGSKVFLQLRGKILDAMEDFIIPMHI